MARAPAGSSCTADAAPTTGNHIQVPSAIDLAQPIKVTIIDGVYGPSIALSPAQT